MDNYSVTTPIELRDLCIRKNWFTEGTNEQYRRLFYLNEHGCPIEEIATVVWLCSDSEKNCRSDILHDLRAAQEEHLMYSSEAINAEGERRKK